MSDFFPTISIIVPVYNGARTIEACIESLLNQSYPSDRYELIVVENGSTDDTTCIVERYPVRLLHSARRGPAAARNIGLANSQADIIAFTDADCVAHPDWLIELVKPYANVQVGGVGGAIVAHARPERNMIEMFSEEHAPLINFVSGAGEFLPHLYTANASYRRSVLERVDGFNAALVTAEDVDLAWRTQLQLSVQLAYATDAIVYHQHRSTRDDLARQYRQYGLGEILLDTLYGKQPGYPRHRSYQLRRLAHQLVALPRYLASAILRRLRLARGRATVYQATVPGLWFLIESSNVRGKLEGLWATRFMTDARPILNADAAQLISRLYPRQEKSA